MRKGELIFFFVMIVATVWLLHVFSMWGNELP